MALDGGLASELERAGHDLNDPLWSAKVLLEAPEAVLAVHRAFLEAGADCIVTATYQATFQGFAERGLGEADAEAAFGRGVELAVRARDHFWARARRRSRRRRLRPLVAAGVGPYGASLADGSEYRGDYGIGAEALESFHRRRWRTLARSAADLIACETIPTLAEVRALARLADEFGKPAWISFSCPDRGRLADGTELEEAVAVAAAAPGVFALGVNCTAPGNATELVAAIAAGTEKAVVAYPNAGGKWDPKAKRWDAAEVGAGEPETGAEGGEAGTGEPAGAGASAGTGESAGAGASAGTDESADQARGRLDWATACLEWRAAGADAVGGCCRVGPAAIRRMRRALEARRGAE